MLLMSFVAVWASYHFWAASRTVREDLLAVAEGQWTAPLSDMLRDETCRRDPLDDSRSHTGADLVIDKIGRQSS